jgi:hypothetical protein
MQENPHAGGRHRVGAARQPDDAGGKALRKESSGCAQSRGNGQDGEEAFTD